MVKNLVSSLILAKKIRPGQSLDIIIYHHVQYQKKIMIHSSENIVKGGQADRQGRT